MHIARCVSRLTIGAPFALGLLLAGCAGSTTPSVPGIAPALLHGNSGSVDQLDRITASITVDGSARNAFKGFTNVYAHAWPFRKTDAPRGGAANDLKFFGGPVLFEAGSYNILVNGVGNPNTWGLYYGFPGGFVGRFSLSSLNHMMDQYTGATRNNRYPVVGNIALQYNQTGTYHDQDIGAIIEAAVNQVTHQTGYRFVYNVFLPAGQADCSVFVGGCYAMSGGYCAYHFAANDSMLRHLVFSVIPWQNITGCQADTRTVQDSSANALAHEVSEEITDPDGTAWQDTSGMEIADKCVSDGFFNILMSPGPIKYNIHQDYSNHSHGCSFSP